MNKTRRKTLNDIYAQLESLHEALEEVLNEEEEARDNIPESLQNTEKYDIAQNACDNLDSAICSLDEVLEYIQNAVE